MAVQALNQANLKQIGQIISHMPEGSCIRKSFTANHPLLPCLAVDPVVVEYAAGMPMLVVFTDEEQQVFYLDRVLRLDPGTVFAIAPLRQECAVNFLYENRPPQPLPPKDASSVEVAVSDLRFDRLYTYFRQEIAGDFFFRGEQHELYELVWLEQGELHTVVNGQDVLLQPQELMIIDRNAWHIQFSDRDCSFITATFDLDSDNLRPLVNRRLHLPKILRPLMTKLLEEHTPQTFAFDYTQALIQILLIELLRNPEMRRSASPLPATLQAENLLLDRLLQFISRELHRKIPLQELAAFAHVSVPYLYKLFESHLGLPPSQLITKLRLDESKLLMRQDSMRISDVAAQLGFSSVQHFSRQFHRCCGCTPSEYLRSVRGKT